MDPGVVRKACGCRACDARDAAAAADAVRVRLDARRAYLAEVEPDARLRVVEPEVGWRLGDVWIAAVVTGVPLTDPQEAAFSRRVMEQVVREFTPPTAYVDHARDWDDDDPRWYGR